MVSRKLELHFKRHVVNFQICLREIQIRQLCNSPRDQPMQFGDMSTRYVSKKINIIEGRPDSFEYTEKKIFRQLDKNLGVNS